MDPGAELGARELDVMAVLWTRGSGTVGEVRAALPAALAHTTVLTILRNLDAKGMVRREAEGRGHRYAPAVAREEVAARVLRRVVATLYAGAPELLLAEVAELEPMSPEAIRRVRKRLKGRVKAGRA